MKKSVQVFGFLVLVMFIFFVSFLNVINAEDLCLGRFQMLENNNVNYSVASENCANIGVGWTILNLTFDRFNFFLENNATFFPESGNLFFWLSNNAHPSGDYLHPLYGLGYDDNSLVCSPDLELQDNILKPLVIKCTKSGDVISYCYADMDPAIGYNHISLCFNEGGEELAGDGLDNDCDGVVDEGEVPITDPSLLSNLTAYYNFNIEDGTTDVFSPDVWNDNDGVGTNTEVLSGGVINDYYNFKDSSKIVVAKLNSSGLSQSWWMFEAGRWVFYANANGTYYKYNRTIVNLPYSLNSMFFIDSNKNLTIANGITNFRFDEIALWAKVLNLNEINEIIDETVDETDPHFNDPICGNGVVEIFEECDDGNSDNGDCCTNNCLVNNEFYGVLKNEVFGVSNYTTKCYAHGCVLGEVDKRCDINEVITNSCVNDTSAGVYHWIEGTLDCSPETCGTSGTGIVKCTENNHRFFINFCHDYNTSTSCGNADSEICIRSVNQDLEDSWEDLGYSSRSEIPDEGFCETGFPLNPESKNDPTYGTCNYYAENCSCLWEDSQCKSHFEESRNCSNADGTTTGRGKCIFTTIKVIDNCNTTGYMTYERNATWETIDGDYFEPLEGTCESYSKQYKCIQTVKLNFFGLSEFFISLSLISVIYFAYVIGSKRVK